MSLSGDDSVPADVPIQTNGSSTPPVVLSIAGSDSGGGAGISADLLSIAACGGHGTLAITAVTAQNTTAVDAVFPLDSAAVEAQIVSVTNDMKVTATKSGFLGSVAAIDVIEAHRDQLGLLVVDPVLVNGGGIPMFGDDLVSRYRNLFEAASAVTPNVSEAQLITGIACDSVAGCERAALEMAAAANTNVIVTGFLDGEEAIDVYAAPGLVRRFHRRAVRTRNVHGTGCSFSSALATYLARGVAIGAAVEAAGNYVAAAIRGSALWTLGAGHGPIDHLAQCDLGRSSAIR